MRGTQGFRQAQRRRGDQRERKQVDASKKSTYIIYKKDVLENGDCSKSPEKKVILQPSNIHHDREMSRTRNVCLRTHAGYKNQD